MRLLAVLRGPRLYSKAPAAACFSASQALSSKSIQLCELSSISFYFSKFKRVYLLTNWKTLSDFSFKCSSRALSPVFPVLLRGQCFSSAALPLDVGSSASPSLSQLTCHVSTLRVPGKQGLFCAFQISSAGPGNLGSECWLSNSLFDLHSVLFSQVPPYI